MASSTLRNFVVRITDRLCALVLGSLVAQSEADAALNEVECLDRLEEAALRYDADNKPQLADRLRRRAASLTVDDPGGMAAAALGQLPETTPAEPLQLPASEAPKRRRRRATSGDVQE